MGSAQNQHPNCSWRPVVQNTSNDEYTYRIPNPKHTPKYTKAKVLQTQDKQRISWAALQSSTNPIKSIATASLPSMLPDTH